MWKAKLADEKILEEVRQIFRDNEGVQVSIDHVAKRVGMTWATTRALLWFLTYKGELIPVKTTRGYLFLLKPKEAQTAKPTMK
jgi:response regulator of citrate/malate metabolism